jgi:hypothetical protein
MRDPPAWEAPGEHAPDQKFTDPVGELTEARKRELVLTSLDPQAEMPFNGRLQELRIWLFSLRRQGREVGDLADVDQILQKLYYTNRLRAVRRLDESLRKLALLDGIPVPTTLPTPLPSSSPAPVGALPPPPTPAPEPSSMDEAWRGLRAQVSGVRSRVRCLRGKVDGVDRLIAGASPADLPPAVEAVRLSPAIIHGGQLARIGLTLRHAGNEAPRIRWRCREGRFLHTDEGAAVWQAPWEDSISLGQN